MRMEGFLPTISLQPADRLSALRRRVGAAVDPVIMSAGE